MAERHHFGSHILDMFQLLQEGTPVRSYWAQSPANFSWSPAVRTHKVQVFRDRGPSWRNLGGITLGFWTLDILACFCVGYYARDGTLVVSLRKIAKQMLGCTTYWCCPGHLSDSMFRPKPCSWCKEVHVASRKISWHMIWVKLERGYLHVLGSRYILSWFPLDVVIASWLALSKLFWGYMPPSFWSQEPLKSLIHSTIYPPWAVHREEEV